MHLKPAWLCSVTHNGYTETSVIILGIQSLYVEWFQRASTPNLQTSEPALVSLERQWAHTWIHCVPHVPPRPPRASHSTRWSKVEHHQGRESSCSLQEQFAFRERPRETFFYTP